MMEWEFKYYSVIIVYKNGIPSLIAALSKSSKMSIQSSSDNQKYKQ